MSNIRTFTDIPIGTKLELTVTDPMEGKIDIDFISQIEGYTDVNTMRILAPIYEAKIYPVKVNSHIEAYLFYKSNQVFQIKGVVTNRIIIDDIAFLDMRVTENVKRIQRRQYFRFDCSVPVAFYDKPKEEEQQEPEIYGHTVDLSGGGLSVITEIALVKDKLIGGYIDLGEYKVNFVGKVLRCNRKIINDELQYISSISFSDMGFKDREKIVGYIFSRQRMLLNKWLRGN